MSEVSEVESRESRAARRECRDAVRFMSEEPCRLSALVVACGRLALWPVLPAACAAQCVALRYASAAASSPATSAASPNSNVSVTAECPRAVA